MNRSSRHTISSGRLHRSSRSRHHDNRATRLPVAIESLESRQLLSAVTLDSTFGSGGSVLHDLGADSASAYGVHALAGGKFLVAGAIVNFGDSDFLLARFNADGSLDSSFGHGGMVTLDFGSTTDAAYSMAVQSDGRIILA